MNPGPTPKKNHSKLFIKFCPMFCGWDLNLDLFWKQGRFFSIDLCARQSWGASIFSRNEIYSWIHSNKSNFICTQSVWHTGLFKFTALLRHIEMHTTLNLGRRRSCSIPRRLGSSEGPDVHIDLDLPERRNFFFSPHGFYGTLYRRICRLWMSFLEILWRVASESGGGGGSWIGAFW